MISHKTPILAALLLCSLLTSAARAQNEPPSSPVVAAPESATSQPPASPQPASKDTPPQATAAQATASQEPVPSGKLPSSTDTTSQLLDQTLPEAEKIQLQAAGQAFTGYFLAASQQPVKGAVILLADRDQHPASAGVINTLRHKLAQHHWHTLALADTASDMGNSQQRLAAASQYFNRMGIASIAIVAQGYSAGQALVDVAALPAASNPALPPTTPFKSVQAVILLNANTRLEDGSDSLDNFKDQPVTLVDAYTLSDFQQQQQANLRQQTARRLNTAYQQIRLPALSPVALEPAQPADSNRVSQRIRGWLDKHMNSQLNKPPAAKQASIQP